MRPETKLKRRLYYAGTLTRTTGRSRSLEVRRRVHLNGSNFYYCVLAARLRELLKGFHLLSSDN
jgi:hypothetical protein